MTQPSLTAAAIPLDPSAKTPLYRQLYLGLRGLILGGHLAAGAALPAGRTIAREFGLGRNTVLAALEQLQAEGYLVGRQRSVLRVSQQIPQQPTQQQPAQQQPAQQQPAQQQPTQQQPTQQQPAQQQPTQQQPTQQQPAQQQPSAPDLGPPRPDPADFATGDQPTSDPPATNQPASDPRPISARGRALADFTPRASQAANTGRAFAVGLSAFEGFPHKTWARLVAKQLRPRPGQAQEHQRALFGYGPAAGVWRLRQAIAQYLAVARGVVVQAEQVIVTSGAQQALDLVARVLLDPGEPAWIEDPGYIGAQRALLAAGARLVPVPLDGEGLMVSEGLRRAPRARLAYVTPSHQFPLGMTLGLGRRVQLLAWAEANRSWIVEDDYDSEFRYNGQPLTALAGLDQQARVLYIGSFSKVLSPGLRLGYLVAPNDLVDVLLAARIASHFHLPQLEQAALAELMLEGHFARHIRQMRDLYGERQGQLLALLREHMAGQIELGEQRAGMHLVAWLIGQSDRAAWAQARAHGVKSERLSAFTLDQASLGRSNALLLGYSGINLPEMRAGVAALAQALGG
jgi:GntR family transcriptional regulator / MocR family aminotransferase